MSAVIESAVVGAQSLGYSSDELLISRLRAHDDDAFAVLVGRYERQLLAFCRRMLGSHEDAEDVLQDTFAAAYKAILADEREIDCRPWLYQIARNRCLNSIRGRRPTEPLAVDGTEFEATLGTADQVARRVELKLLVTDILALPDQQRQALVLHELEGCSYEQISHQLGASLASVRSLLLRARKTLLALAEGRALACPEVRARLEESDPSAAVRRHLELCPDCAQYRRQLKRQPLRIVRALSPFGPLLAFKSRILRWLAPHVTAGGTGAAGAGGAATAGAGGVATAGAGLSVVAAKALAGLAVLAAAGTGAIVAQQAAPATPHHARAHPAIQAPAPAPAQNVAPAPVPAPAPPAAITRSARQHSAAPPPVAPSAASTVPPTQAAGPTSQNSQTGAQTTGSPQTAARTRPIPGSNAAPTRTRPEPVGPANSQTPFAGGSQTSTSSGQGSQTSGQGSHTTSSGQGSQGGGSSSSQGGNSSPQGGSSAIQTETTGTDAVGQDSAGGAGTSATRSRTTS